MVVFDSIIAIIAKIWYIKSVIDRSTVYFVVVSVISPARRNGYRNRIFEIFPATATMKKIDISPIKGFDMTCTDKTGRSPGRNTLL